MTFAFDYSKMPLVWHLQRRIENATGILANDQILTYLYSKTVQKGMLDPRARIVDVLDIETSKSKLKTRPHMNSNKQYIPHYQSSQAQPVKRAPPSGTLRRVQLPNV